MSEARPFSSDDCTATAATAPEYLESTFFELSAVDTSTCFSFFIVVVVVVVVAVVAFSSTAHCCGFRSVDKGASTLPGHSNIKECEISYLCVCTMR